MGLFDGGLIGAITKPLFGDVGEIRDSGSTQALSQISQQQFDLIRPLLEAAVPQLSNLLQTGTIGATLPIISRGVESARVAGSQALAGTEERLVRQGITGTERETLLGNLASEQALGISQIPTNIQMQTLLPILQDIFRTALGQPALATQGLGTAAGLETQAGISSAQIQAQQQAEVFDFLGGLGLLLGFSPGKGGK